jgi:hypothetical protein
MRLEKGPLRVSPAGLDRGPENTGTVIPSRLQMALALAGLFGGLMPRFGIRRASAWQLIPTDLV